MVFDLCLAPRHRRKNLQIGRHPEYRYYLWALYAKILGGIFFTLVYIYYYGNGDTLSYFNASAALLAK